MSKAKPSRCLRNLRVETVFIASRAHHVKSILTYMVLGCIFAPVFASQVVLIFPETCCVVEVIILSVVAESNAQRDLSAYPKYGLCAGPCSGRPVDDAQRRSNADVNNTARRNERSRLRGHSHQVWRLRYHRCRVEGRHWYYCTFCLERVEQVTSESPQLWYSALHLVTRTHAHLVA